MTTRPANRALMPRCAAFADDIRQAFGPDAREVCFGWRVTYAEENGEVRGKPGDVGVVPNLAPAKAAP